MKNSPTLISETHHQKLLFDKRLKKSIVLFLERCRNTVRIALGFQPFTFTWSGGHERKDVLPRLKEKYEHCSRQSYC